MNCCVNLNNSIQKDCWKCFEEYIKIEDINEIDNYGYSPLEYIIVLDRIDMLKKLLEIEISVDYYNKNGDHLLHVAVINQSIKSVKALLDYGVDVNVKTLLLVNQSVKYTALYFAVILSNRYENKYPIINLLLNHGADPYIIYTDTKQSWTIFDIGNTNTLNFIKKTIDEISSMWIKEPNEE